MAPLVRLLIVFAAVSIGSPFVGFLVAPNGGPVDSLDAMADDDDFPPLPVQVAADAGDAPGPAPETGWWWTPEEPGRGFILDRIGSQLVVGALAYEADGRASWYLASGTLDCSIEFSGMLVAYSGGQTLGGRFRRPAASREAGRLGIRFLSPTQATVTLPGGRAVSLERYRLDGGTRAAFEPEAGWWWNPAEPGRGFAVEVRNGAVLLTAVTYDERGYPVWYVSSGPLEGMSYRGRWLRLGGGITLDGGYRVPGDTDDAGAVAVTFVDARRAALTLPDGRALPISRLDAASAQAPLALAPAAVDIATAGTCTDNPIRLAAAP